MTLTDKTKKHLAHTVIVSAHATVFMGLWVATNILVPLATYALALIILTVFISYDVLAELAEKERWEPLIKPYKEAIDLLRSQQ